MSTRTFIEINHDFITEMANNGHISKDLRDALASGYVALFLGERNIPGMRFVGVRHHSDPFTLEIHGRQVFREDR